MIFQIDRYASHDEGIDIFPEDGGEGDADYVKKFRIALFSLYLMEMFISEAEGRYTLFVNHNRYLRFQQPFDNKIHIKLSYIYNNFVNISGSSSNGGITGKLDSLANILLATAAEQNDLQINYIYSYTRFYHIYAKNNEVNKIFFDRTGITLKRFIGLSWALLSFIESKKAKVFTKENFLQYLSSTVVSSVEVEAFLSMISLTRKEFSNKYRSFRKKENGEWFTYDERMTFDRGLPKISYFFPLLIEGENYIHISHNSYREFMKMNAVYRHMTENFEDIKFKIQYAGPLFEQYARDIVFKYNERHSLCGNIYGDQEYKIKKQTYKEPDVIFETENYMIIIECKTSPYSLSLVRYLDPVYMRSLEEGIKKSIVNINDRFLVHRYNGGEKKILKLLVFYEENHMLFTFLENMIDDMVGADDLYVMGVSLFETVFSGYIKPLPELFDEFSSLPKRESNGLREFLESQLTLQRVVEDDKIMDEIANELGIHKSPDSI